MSYDDWIEGLKLKGHSPVYDEVGDYHSGARCTICEEFFCQHCDSDPSDVTTCISALSEADFKDKIQEVLKQNALLTKLVNELYRDSKRKIQNEAV